MLVVNLFAGPGAGKSTTAAGLFHRLKLAGVNCELVTEYAKDKVWEQSTKVLDDQLYVFAKQHHRLHVLRGNVDVAITDSPLPLSLVYNTGVTADPGVAESFESLVWSLFETFRNLNVLLLRTKPYNPIGRNQTEQEARSLDDKIREELFVLRSFNLLETPGDASAVDRIFSRVLAKLG